jgi:tRNA-Thr(GGU) m(6)t(6)A37 methyltransferase TsaA
MPLISCQSIGVVESPFKQPLHPEEMRGEPAYLVLEPSFAQAATALEPGQHLWVIYHLHQVQRYSKQPPQDLFTRRIASRPNPIGITLVRVLSIEGASITVIGLDAVDGSPILDLKPYLPVWDQPPVHPEERTSLKRRVIALTGGPGGGKSTLVEDLRRDPEWTDSFVALPEAIQYAGFINLSPREKIFQRAVVHLQVGLEEGLKRSLDPDDRRIILCHRGTLDPLAFWLQRGWPEEEFFSFTGIPRAGHFQRYSAVIHLVTAADGVPLEYTRWPQAHRPEEPGEAIQLDHWLEQAWSSHPHYYRLDNREQNWAEKSRAARVILRKIIGD